MTATTSASDNTSSTDTAESLLAEASQRAGGLTDTGDDLHEPLSRFVDSLREEARLTELGELVARERILLHLVNRLGYVADRQKYADIAEQTIERPVFVIGFPRTGTTILHDILAQDPATRAPITWETMFPSPPPEAATFETDPRIALAASLMPTPENETESDRVFRAMHPIGAQLTQECVVLMGETMVTPLFHNQFRVPAYMDWVDAHATSAPSTTSTATSCSTCRAVVPRTTAGCSRPARTCGASSTCCASTPTPASCSPTATRCGR